MYIYTYEWMLRVLFNLVCIHGITSSDTDEWMLRVLFKAMLYFMLILYYATSTHR
jgi:hypothetical protein